MKKLKKIAYLLSVMMIGFLISACVQELRPAPPHVSEPAHVSEPVQRPVVVHAVAPVPTFVAAPAFVAAPVRPVMAHQRVSIVASPRTSHVYQVNPVRQVNHVNKASQVNQVRPVNKVQLSPNTPISKNFAINGFDQVLISGDVSGTVNGGQPQNQLEVNGTVESLKHFSVRTQGGILYIDSSEPVSISLNLATPLRDLAYEGNGKLQIKGIANQSTKLGLSGNSVTSLRGDLVLSRVDVSGNATLHAYWVDSSNLHVVAQNQSKLFLAGVVTNLDIIATGNAEVDAKYLRADNAYIRTTGNADVGVTVNRSLSTLSSDSSTVYYYDNSRVGLHYLDSHGSALRMKGIPNSSIYKQPYGQ